MKHVVLVLCVAACSFEHGSLVDDAGGVDARGVDGPPGCVSFSSQLDTCAMSATADLTLSGSNTFDTMTGKLTNGTTTVSVQAMQIAGKAGPIDVLLVRNLLVTANARLRVVGPIPFGVIAYGTITLATGAVIDASDGGAGARASCSAGPIIGTADSAGAGGGGGGGFGAAGGAGGDGNGDGTHTGGGTGGVAVAKPMGPLGGCPGAKGGQGDDPGGNGGNAGGAVYLASAVQISIAATAGINAGGGGGQGGRVSSFSNGDAGGGGGGAGGMVWLDGPKVRVMGALAANGGGGGEASGGGGSGNSGSPGLLGADAAPGGDGSSNSGTGGGAGGALAVPMGGTPTTILAGGGGGGGGGVGFIVVGSPDKMIATASPAPN